MYILSLCNCFIVGVIDTGDQLLLVSLLPAISYRRCRCYWRQIYSWCHGIDENPGQGLFTAYEATGKIYPSNNDTAPAISSCQCR
jgi:hypothetical protein